MHFLFKLDKRNIEGILETSSADELNKSDGTFLFIPNKKANYKQYDFVSEKIIVLGDLVTKSNSNEIISEIKKNNMSDFGGFFYLIYINTINNSVKIFSSIFNILPVYFYEDERYLSVSSKTELINKIVNKRTINKKYILERILFNYSFFNETIYEDIKLLPCNHFIEIKNNISIKKHFNVTDYFVSEPKSGKKILQEIALRFIELSADYFPEDEAAVSFTSGFDGRTMVAIAKKLNKKFFTYSFGAEDYNDLTLPLVQAKQICVEFIPLTLNDNYIKEESLKCGLDMIIKTEGNASFARAHYRYAAEKLSERVRYVITGNFGSELFRAFQYSGAVMSTEMIAYFDSINDNWINRLNLSDKLRFLNFDNYKNEFEQLITELREYKIEHRELEKSGIFYKYIFEEVFRKYFGAEIVMQSYYLNNRSPYLDPVFIKYLLTTKYAGVYSEFFTNNPIKRFKGQLPYSYIIKNSYPPLLKLITGKGYHPIDLLSFAGKFRILKSKIINSKNQSRDPFSVKANLIFNQNFYSNIKIAETLFNTKMLGISNIKNSITDLTTVIHVLSINYYINKIKINENL